MNKLYILNKLMLLKNLSKVMNVKDTTQFSINIDTKNRLDKLKAEKKSDILEKYNKKKRFVTNTDAINFLLDEYGWR